MSHCLLSHHWACWLRCCTRVPSAPAICWPPRWCCVMSLPSNSLLNAFLCLLLKLISFSSFNELTLPASSGLCVFCKASEMPGSVSLLLCCFWKRKETDAIYWVRAGRSLAGWGTWPVKYLCMITGNPVRQKQGGCCLFVLNVNFSVGCFLGNFLALEIVQVQAELLG